jgi:Zinc finger, C3HC4 type (RING finger)
MDVPNPLTSDEIFARELQTSQMPQIDYEMENSKLLKTIGKLYDDNDSLREKYEKSKKTESGTELLYKEYQSSLSKLKEERDSMIKELNEKLEKEHKESEKKDKVLKKYQKEEQERFAGLKLMCGDYMVLWKKLHENEKISSIPTCIICLERVPSILLFPCKHANMCGECAAKITDCPTCRIKIFSRFEIFM